MDLPTQEMKVRLPWGQFDGLSQVLQGIDGISLPEVQLTAVLVCLPQLRALADGFRQQDSCLIRPA